MSNKSPTTRCTEEPSLTAATGQAQSESPTTTSWHQTTGPVCPRCGRDRTQREPHRPECDYLDQQTNGSWTLAEVGITPSQTTRELCPTCGALPCDQTLDPDKDPIRTLLAEGLDLCVRARKLDDGLLVKSMKDNFGYQEPEGTRCLTPWLWTQEQYDTDLADWEKRARKALS